MLQGAIDKALLQRTIFTRRLTQVTDCWHKLMTADILIVYIYMCVCDL